MPFIIEMKPDDGPVDRSGTRGGSVASHAGSISPGDQGVSTGHRIMPGRSTRDPVWLRGRSRMPGHRPRMTRCPKPLPKSSTRRPCRARRAGPSSPSTSPQSWRSACRGAPRGRSHAGGRSRSWAGARNGCADRAWCSVSPASSLVATAHPMTESSTVANTPPVHTPDRVVRDIHRLRAAISTSPSPNGDELEAQQSADWRRGAMRPAVTTSRTSRPVNACASRPPSLRDHSRSRCARASAWHFLLLSSDVRT